MAVKTSSPLSRVIPIQAHGTALAAGRLLALPEPTGPAQAKGPTLDRLARPLRDLRISVTDRCNFRCSYCMPRTAFGRDYPFLASSELLSYEEITAVAKATLGLGVTKIRLTGGEPLLRRDLETLVAQLADLRTPDGQAPQLSLTTNGALLSKRARSLQEAGLQRVTVSLDALDPGIFAAMTDSAIAVQRVLEGIDAALATGLGPVKVNMVVKRGVNDCELLPMARYFRGRGVELRFIEYMDVGHTNDWQHTHVLPNEEVRARLHAHHPLVAAAEPRGSQTATRWRYADGQGSVGFISSVTGAFCDDCTRLRLSTDGRLYRCLFAHEGFDLKTALRSQASHGQDLQARIAALWHSREDQYSKQRRSDATHDAASPPRVEMSFIGG